MQCFQISSWDTPFRRLLVGLRWANQHNNTLIVCQRSSLAIFQELHSEISPATQRNGVFLSGSDGNHIEDVAVWRCQGKRFHFKESNGQRSLWFKTRLWTEDLKRVPTRRLLYEKSRWRDYTKQLRCLWGWRARLFWRGNPCAGLCRSCNWRL